MLRSVGWLCTGFFILAAAQACHHSAPNTIRKIAIQPVYPFDSPRIGLLKQDLVRFFRRPVIILTPIHVPTSFINHEKGERYSADSIIEGLSHAVTDSITQIVAFTSEDIYTTKRKPDGQILHPTSKYSVWGIFGLGYCPGRASVMSDCRLECADQTLFRHRLRTVLLHEIGHNLGLPHCPNPHCIMNDANESITTVDNSGSDYCRDCRRKLRL